MLVFAINTIKTLNFNDGKSERRQIEKFANQIKSQNSLTEFIKFIKFESNESARKIYLAIWCGKIQ